MKYILYFIYFLSNIILFLGMLFIILDVRMLIPGIIMIICGIFGNIVIFILSCIKKDNIENNDLNEMDQLLE